MSAPENPSNRTAFYAVVAAAVLAIALGVSIVTAAIADDPTPEAPTAATQTVTVAAPKATACSTVFADEQQVIRAAHDAMSQWRLHISAMNKLVAGKISMDQAMGFWAQTRAGALRHIEKFR